jgi:diguanylate cyclase (GGDEF)-like protein
VILPNYTLAEGSVLAERIRTEVLKECVDGCSDSLSISAGVAEYRGEASNAEQLFKDADNALREVKARGKNRIGTFRHEES